MYVITSKADQGQNCGKVMYYAVVHYTLNGSGKEYPYWTHLHENARLFENIQDAINTMRKEILHAKPVTMASGKVYPSMLVHLALGLDDAVTKGACTVCISTAGLDPVSENYISGEIR